MSSKIKNFLKKFFPSSANTSKYYADTIISKLDLIEKRFEIQDAADKSITEKLDQIDSNEKLLSAQISDNDKKFNDALTKSTDNINSGIAALKDKLEISEQQITEKLDNINITEKVLNNELLGSNQRISGELNKLDCKIQTLKDTIDENGESSEKRFDSLDLCVDRISTQIEDSDKKSKDNFDILQENTKAIENNCANISKKSDEIKENAIRITGKIDAVNSEISKKIYGVSLQISDSDKKLTDIKMSANGLNEKLNAINQSLKEIESIDSNLFNCVKDLNRLLDATGTKHSEDIKNSLQNLSDEMQAYRKNFEKQIFDKVETVRKLALDAMRTASETVWADVFNNTITESQWLTNKNFSPGRWAVGYPNLYVTYRVLNEAKPKKILELGLGQSTKMISQYATAHEGTEHIVIESDPDWISFFKNNYSITEKTKPLKFDYEVIPYNDSINVRVFKGLSDFIREQKFDFITIDAPWSGDQTQLSRIDVLLAIPECLNKDFIILFDDCERPAENNTLAKMEQKLNNSNIEYARGRYSGKKDCVLICAKQLKFLASM